MSKKYSGSGILVIDTYRNIPCVVLFAKNNGEYHDLGGSIDKKDSKNKHAVELTAIREAQEESINVLQIKNLNIIQSLPYIDLEHQGAYYRCYVLYLKHKFPTNAYYNNVNSLNAISQYDNIPHQWKETNKFMRIRISDLINCKNYNMCKTINNHIINIKGRTRRILSQLFQTMPVLKPIGGTLSIDARLWNTQTLNLS